MPCLSRPALLLTSLLALLTLGVSLTMYTQSVFDPGPAQDVQDLLRRALGDRLPALPPFSVGQTGLVLTPVERDHRQESAPTGDPAFHWALAAARSDSAALRSWLSPATLRWARRDRDSVQVAFVRLTWHRGCPLLSRLDAVLSQQAQRDLQVVRVSASCPVVAAGGQG
jgi:hypothetical protein